MPIPSIVSPVAPVVKLMYTVDEGGTGVQNLSQAAQNLNLLLYSDIGNTSGKVPVADVQGNLPLQLTQQVAVLSESNVSVNGSLMTYVSQNLTLLITDYDSSTVYVVAASAGTVTRNGATITYTAPSTPGSYTVTVNGKVYTVVVSSAAVVTPTIITPVNNASGQGANVTITSSAFQIMGSSDTHEGTDWQISESPSFDTFFADVVNSSVSKTSYTVTGLSPSTVYYVRIRYKGTSLGYSEWSSPIRFGTQGAWSQVGSLVASDAAGYDYFGNGCVISKDGTYAVVGSPSKTDGTIMGAVYVFRFDVSGGWVQEAKLIQDAVTIDMLSFGSSVQISLDNQRIAVACASQYSNGRVYIFKKTTGNWDVEAIITEPNLNNGDYYAASISVNDAFDLLLVGVTQQSEAVDPTPYGYVKSYTRSGTTWSSGPTLEAHDPISRDLYGKVVLISPDGTRAAVASSLNNVYIYTYSNSVFTLEQTLTSVGSSSLACNSDFSSIAIGNSGKPVGYSSAGSVLIYKRTGTSWTLEIEIENPQPTVAGEKFGISVSMSGNGGVLAIGCDKDTGATANTGTVYIYSKVSNVWTQKAKLYSMESAANDTFGNKCSLSADGRTCLVAAPRMYNVGTYGGKVYLFYTSESVSFVPTIETTSIAAAMGSAWMTTSDPKNIALTEAGDRLAVCRGYSGETAYVDIYKNVNSNWTIEQTITYTSSVNASYVDFGDIVRFDALGDRIFIGSNQPYTGGTIHVYKRTGNVWTQEAVLNSDGSYTQVSEVGKSFQISREGDYVISTWHIPGLPENSDTPTKNMRFWKRTGTSWGYQGQFQLHSLVSGTSMSYATAMASSMDGVWLLVGNKNHPTSSLVNSGRVNFIKKTATGWDYSWVLKTATVPTAGDMFGSVVALAPDSTWALVASSGANKIESFSRAGDVWTLRGSLPMSGAKFTISTLTTIDPEKDVLELSPNGNYAYLGHRGYDNPNVAGTYNGAVFIWKRNGNAWDQEAVISPSSGSYFGEVVKLSSDGIKLFIENRRSNDRDLLIYE